MSLYRSCGCGQRYVFFMCVMHDMNTRIVILVHKLCNLFIGYGKNRVCHRMGQRSMCCQIDAALLLVVHIPQHSSTALLYVAPSLTYTQLPYLIYKSCICAHNSLVALQCEHVPRQLH